MASFDDILAGFRSTDHDVPRESGYALGELTDRRALAVDEAERALRLAAQPPPPRKNDWEDSAGDLVRAAVTAACQELVPVVEEVYAELPTPFSRTAALRLLALVETRAATAVSPGSWRSRRIRATTSTRSGGTWNPGTPIFCYLRY